MARKIIYGFTFTALLLLIFGCYSIIQMRELSEVTKNMYNHPLAVTNATKTIQIKYLNIQIRISQLLHSDDLDEIIRIDHQIRKDEKEIFALYALVFERYLGEKKDIRKSYESFNHSHQLYEKMLELLKKGKKEEASQLVDSEILVTLDKDIKTLIDFARNKSDYFLHNAEQTASQTVTVTVVMILAAITLIILGGLWLTHNIRRSQSELGQRQKKLEQTSRELLQAQKIAKLGIWRWDVRENTVVWDDVSYALCEKNKDFPIRNVDDFYAMLYPEDIPKVEEGIREYFMKGKPYVLPYRIITDQGNIKHFKAQCLTEYGDDRKPSVLYGIAQDVTDEIASQEHLLHQSRLAQMGEMISMIAHQWRQPLGAIASIIIDLKMKMALQTYDLSDTKEREDFQNQLSVSFQDMEYFIKNLTTTIDDFRNFYKQHKKMETLSLVEPIRQAINLMHNSLENENITLRLEEQCTKTFEIFANELVQVLLNLIKNAMENFREKALEKPVITIHCTDTPTGVDIIICDNGGGIPEKILSKIFDPYFSTKNEKNGTGLGLYMSKIIIEDHHGGRMRVCNRDGGACFTLSFRSKK